MVGGTVVLVILLAALAAPLIAPFDPNLQETANRLMPPDAVHWLGTDGFGRDILSRLIYGARSTLLLVVVVVLIMAPLGVAVGLMAGFSGGVTERLFMRVTDIVMSFPRLLLAFAFVAILGPGLINGALALSLTSWPAYARQARVETAALRRNDYLAAAEMVGIKGPRLLLGHVLPLILPSAVIRLALDLSGIILAAAGLGFLGLGVRPPTAEWGSMVAEGTQVIFDQWWVAAVPGCAIFIASLAFNLLADGLRDILDPRHD
jgi:peptide/nickel transport system permease protein